jgi:hypothetical protein
MNNCIIIDRFLSIYTCTRVRWRRLKESIHEEAKARCRCPRTTVCRWKTVIFATEHFVMLHCFLTPPLDSWTYISLMSNYSKNSMGKIWGVFSYIILQKPDGENEGSILNMLWKNSYNPVGQIRINTFSIYHIFHISLIKIFIGKNQEIDINVCAHYLIKNLSWETIL